MKIHNPNDLGAVSSPGAKGTTGVGGSGRPDANRGAESTGPDRAELSGLAGKISQAAGRDATHRAANVEQLRQQVSAGTYRPDSAAISHGIVSEALTNAAAAGGTSKK